MTIEATFRIGSESRMQRHPLAPPGGAPVRRPNLEPIHGA